MTCASTSYGEGEVQARLGSESAGTNTGTARGLEQSNACREIERGSNSRTQSGVELLDRRTLGYTETLTSHGAGWGLEPVEPAERRRVEIACTRFLCATAYRAQALPSRRLVVSFLFSAVSLISTRAVRCRGIYERVCRESLQRESAERVTLRAFGPTCGGRALPRSAFGNVAPRGEPCARRAATRRPQFLNELLYFKRAAERKRSGADRHPCRPSPNTIPS